MIFKIKEIGKDANGDITINADYYTKDKNNNPKTIINQNSIHSKELKLNEVIVELKKNSPEEEDINKETERLAIIAKEDALISEITNGLLEVEKAFNPANFKEEE